MKWSAMWLCFLFITLSGKAPASVSELSYEGPVNWASFQRYMTERQREDRVHGASYIISGAVATIGGVVGYYNSEDSFSRGVYAIAQSVGVAAMGYGANRLWNGNEYNSFYHAVEGAPLSASQKVELLRRFLEKENDERERRRWIKIGTHSLIAALNFYSASREQDRDVRGILHFLAGTNLVIAVSYTF